MEIKLYLNIILRRWWLIALGAIVAGLTAFIISRNTTPVYSASAQLLLDEPPGTAASEYNQLLLEQRLALTYAEIIEMRSVLDAAIEALDLPFTAAELRDLITVSVLRDTKIIDITVEDTNPDRVADIANTIGTVFIEQNQQREALRYAEPIENWQARLVDLTQQIEDTQEQLANLSDATSAQDQASVLLLENQLSDLQVRHDDALDNLNALLAEQARQSSNVVLLEKSQPEHLPVRPQIMRNTILATVVGGMLGLGLVFLIEYIDDTIKEPEQIRQIADLPTLGTVSIIKSARGPGKLITHELPRDPNSEAYRTLRTNLNFAIDDNELRSLLITSPSPTDGKSTTVANLGVAFAQSGKEVIIIDSDLRRPVQHQFFDTGNQIGLTTAYLDNRSPIKRHLRKTHISRLRLLPSGPIPPNPAELLGSSRIKYLIKSLLGEADLLIFDSPPVLSVTDAAVMGSRVDGCLFVIKAEQTKELALVEAADRLNKTGGKIFGVVLNMTKKGRGYYYYYDQKKYDLNKGDSMKKQPGFIGRLLPSSRNKN